MTRQSSTDNAFKNIQKTAAFKFGKEIRVIMFDCDFNDDCFYFKSEDRISQACQDYEKFGMVNQRECEVVFSKAVMEGYQQYRLSLTQPFLSGFI